MNFSSAVTTPSKQRGPALSVTNGRVRSVTMTIGRADEWLVSIEPTAVQDVTVALAPTTSCDSWGAVCARDGRMLSSAAELRVEGPLSVPLTGTRHGYEPVHFGPTVIELRIDFSWPVTITPEDMKNHAFQLTNAEVTNAYRVLGSEDNTWVFWILPLSYKGMGVVLPVTTDCEADGAICTSDGRKLSQRIHWEFMYGGPPDETAPEVRRAEVTKTNLVLTYAEGLQEDTPPPASAFAVTVAGASRALADSEPVSVSGRRVTLTLATSVAHGESVTVSYTVPASNPLQDIAGNAAAAVSDYTVSNLTPESDSTPPTLHSATANGQYVVLTYSEDLDGNTPPASAFALTVAGASRVLADSEPVAVSGRTVTLTLATSVAHGESVTVSYTVPASNPLQDIAGNAAAAVSGHEVTNQSPGTSTQQMEDDALTATFHNLPESHGTQPFTFELRFSESVPVSYLTLRSTAFTVMNGNVIRAGRIERNKNLRWRITVQPISSGNVVVTLPAMDDCEADGAICTEDDRPLAASVVAVVPETPPVVVQEPEEEEEEEVVKEEKLTVAFERIPDTHDGSTAFSIRLAFSLAPKSSLDAATLRANVLLMSLGYRDIRATRVYKIGDDSGRRWHFDVPFMPFYENSKHEDIVVSVGPTQNCEDEGAVCTEEGLKLSNQITKRIKGPPGVSVRDTRANEDRNATADVRVTLSRASAGSVTVDYATADGTAIAGQDYISTSGTLTFAAGESEATVSVPLLNDNFDDGGETFTLQFSNPAGGGSHIVDGTAVVTISDNDTESPLSGEFHDLPDTHSDEAFTFELRFSEQISLSYRTLQDGVQVTGGAVTGVSRFEADNNRRWRIRVEPEVGADVSIVLPETTDCTASDAICTSDNRPLAAAVSGVVPGEPFTVRFEDVPATHDGSNEVELRLVFNKNPEGLSYRTLQEHALKMRQSNVTGRIRVRREDSARNDRWVVVIQPIAHTDMEVSIGPSGSCSDEGAVCMPNGEALSNTATAEIKGPPAFRVADARVTEAAGATVDFAVTLSRASSETVTVDYATANGSARAGSDYTQATGTLTFAVGETATTVAVAVLDDAIDEGEETFKLTLTNASGGDVWIDDGDATGTIVNIDPMPKGLLARFGRTAALQVVEYVEERLQARRESGFEGRLAGHQLRGAEDMVTDVADRFVYGLGGLRYGDDVDRDFGLSGVLRSLFRRGDVLTGSSFTLNRETDRGGVFSFWSRGARSSFFGREDDLGLDGTVRTAMLGTDYAKGPFLVGLSLSRSWGLGSYTGGVAGGRVASSVTGLYPWLGYRLTDRMTVWAVGGYGVGGMLLSQEDALQLSAGLSMSLAAVGTRGELIGRGGNGFRLSYKADALWVGTSSEAVSGSSGNLAATRSVVSRVRTALEGSHVLTFRSRLSLSPSVMVGLRHDGGDAETGSGLDIAGGLVVSDPLTGLEVDMRVRTLLIHEAEGYGERGMAVSFSYNPSPSTPLGLTMRMSPSWGGQATSGAEALWGRPTMSGIAGGGYATGNRLDADLGYGLALGRRFVGTPRLGFATSAQGRDYRVGYGIGTLVSEGLRFELNLDAHRRASPLSIGADHGIVGRATIGW